MNIRVLLKYEKTLDADPYETKQKSDTKSRVSDKKYDWIKIVH